jgi:hypothetical protein
MRQPKRQLDEAILQYGEQNSRNGRAMSLHDTHICKERNDANAQRRQNQNARFSICRGDWGLWEYWILLDIDDYAVFDGIKAGNSRYTERKA